MQTIVTDLIKIVSSSSDYPTNVYFSCCKFCGIFFLPSKVLEIDAFKISANSVFFCYPSKISKWSYFIQRKSCWLVLRSCSMLLSRLAFAMHPLLASLVTVDMWTFSNAAGFRVSDSNQIENRNKSEFVSILNECFSTFFARTAEEIYKNLRQWKYEELDYAVKFVDFYLQNREELCFLLDYFTW